LTDKLANEASVFLQLLEVVDAEYQAGVLGWSVAARLGVVRVTVIRAPSTDFPEGITTIGEGPTLEKAARQLGENMISQAMQGAPEA